MAPLLETDRLILRDWRNDDRPEFARLNADPRVMEFMPHALSREDSDAMVDQIRRSFDDHGFGLWAVEEKDGAPFIGFVGLAVPRFEANFTPCVEIGWRLAAEYWGRGYATEAATTALRFGFETKRREEIVSFTTTMNLRSRRVMERLGMRRFPADDYHPAIPHGHPIRPHVLCRLTRSEWFARSR